ncbi:uncharacterized protein LOC106011255 [Aplysia californica]|uniref:Uncharacterized protein LOC106011255 n=1 Tax=Aplysia californica TaxID=6500 RepID=A0ABM0ZW22_APLCA|nr:uncharacterized protein LOC106011255 [Aplysia californica]
MAACRGMFSSVLADGETESFLDWAKLGRLTFVASAQFKFHPEFYDAGTAKRSLSIETRLMHIGRTSGKLAGAMSFHDETSSPVLEGEYQFILVDPETRRADQFPDWWREKFLKHVVKTEKHLIIQSKPVPTDCEIHVHEITVLPSDIDPYLHVNWSSYLKFCLDAYTSWHIQSFGYEEKGDPFRLVHKVCMSFKGDASIGDVLCLKFWKDVLQENQAYHFHISKKAKVIQECTIEFY